jgi:hypothetical protein
MLQGDYHPQWQARQSTDDNAKLSPQNGNYITFNHFNRSQMELLTGLHSKGVY